MFIYLRSKFTILFVLALIIISCATASVPPLPVTLNIVPPSPDIPEDIAAFSGFWEGKWGGVQNTIIVIEKINEEKAELLISYGDLEQGVGFKPPNYYRYITANVLPGPILEFNESTEPNPSAVEKGDYVCPCTATFARDKDLDILIVYWEYSNYNHSHPISSKNKYKPLEFTV